MRSCGCTPNICDVIRWCWNAAGFTDHARNLAAVVSSMKNHVQQYVFKRCLKRRPGAVRVEEPAA